MREGHLVEVITPHRISAFLRTHGRHRSSCGLHALFLVTELNLARKTEQLRVTIETLPPLLDGLDEDPDAVLVCLYGRRHDGPHEDTHTFVVGKAHDTQRYFMTQGYLHVYTSTLVFYDTRDGLEGLLRDILGGLCSRPRMDKSVYRRRFFAEPAFDNCDDMTLTAARFSSAAKA